MKSGPGHVVFNMPAALTSQKIGGEEIEHSLPPHRPRPAYLVDRYPASPATWMRSEGNITSYFVPVEENYGMWLDFNRTLEHTPQHVAIVVSVQGINAVTGLPCKDANLEQYIETCPKHKTKFGPERFCKKCNFKWPKQNYIASTGTPSGYLWLDGFRAADGLIRQYVLTAEKMRGVANAIVGENRVFAIGLSFFLSKTPRPQEVPVSRPYGSSVKFGDSGQAVWTSTSLDEGVYGSPGLIGADGVGGDEGVYGASINYMATESDMTKSVSMGDDSKISRKLSCFSPQPSAMRSIKAKSGLIGAAAPKAVSVKKMEIAAGARIRQIIYDDPNDLSFWHTKAESLIVINYCLEVDAHKIIEQGEVDVDGSKEGFLQNVPTGN